jgi:hypothetical protein
MRMQRDTMKPLRVSTSELGVSQAGRVSQGFFAPLTIRPRFAIFVRKKDIHAP